MNLIPYPPRPRFHGPLDNLNLNQIFIVFQNKLMLVFYKQQYYISTDQPASLHVLRDQWTLRDDNNNIHPIPPGSLASRNKYGMS